MELEEVKKPLPKIKTRKTAAKRFKVTATGKILRGHVGQNHLMTKKRESRKRRLELESSVKSGERRTVKRMVPGIRVSNKACQPSG